MRNRIDHISIGAANLKAGVSAMASAIGVTLARGCNHDLMGTHNRVMRAGIGCFFELIAIDPAAPAPGRTRWFTLDCPATQLRLNARPRALCWVVNTDNLDAVVAQSPVSLGETLTFNRGKRSWRLTVPSDGHLPGNGLLPAFIEWSPGPHPSDSHADMGVRLEGISLTHPNPPKLARTLDRLQVAHLATVTPGEAALSFELSTPNGLVVID